MVVETDYEGHGSGFDPKTFEHKVGSKGEKEKHWYASIKGRVPCRVSNILESECRLSTRLAMIVDYMYHDEYPFKDANGDSFKYAIPLESCDLLKQRTEL